MPAKFDVGWVGLLTDNAAGGWAQRLCPHLDGHLFAQTPACQDQRPDREVQANIAHWSERRQRAGRGGSPPGADRTFATVAAVSRTGAATRQQIEALLGGRATQLADLAELGVLLRYRLEPVDAVPGRLPYVYGLRGGVLDAFLETYPSELASAIQRHAPSRSRSVRHRLKVMEVWLRLIEEGYVVARPATVLRVNAPSKSWSERWDVVVNAQPLPDVLVRVVSDGKELWRVCVEAQKVAAQRDVRVLIVVSSPDRGLVGEGRKGLRDSSSGWEHGLGYVDALNDPVDPRSHRSCDSPLKRHMDFRSAAAACVQVLGWEDLFPARGVVAHEVLAQGVFSPVAPVMRRLWRRDPLLGEESAFCPAAWTPGGSAWKESCRHDRGPCWC